MKSRPSKSVQEVETSGDLVRSSKRLRNELSSRASPETLLPASDLIRKGLRVVSSRYYSGRRPPSTLLFESTNSKLGDESELFRDNKD